MTDKGQREQEILAAARSKPRRPRPPAPGSVSEEAAAYLSMVSPFEGAESLEPAFDDIEGWQRRIEAQDAPIREMFASALPLVDMLTRTEFEIGGVTTYDLRPKGTGDDAPIFIEVHGGGLVQCAGDLAWLMSTVNAVERPGITWVTDYRMPPLHRYPAALDDCVAAYRRALQERAPEQIIVSGGSAGGNLAAALLLRAKDEGLPMPAALVLATPELDLTESGDSFQVNNGVDFLGSLMANNLLYADGHDLAHPYLSPLFGDLAGLPPTFLQSGTRDLYLSNTVRMHRRLLAAGVPAELHVFEAMPHGSFGGNAPEDREVRAEVRRFERQHLKL